MPTSDVVDTWERFLRLHRVTTKAMDQNLRAAFGYTLDDYDILHQINRHRGPMRMGDLAKQLLVADSSCHRLVTKLVDRGLIQRLCDEADRRVVLVQLTNDGKRVRRRMAATHTKDIRRLVGEPIGASNLATLDAALQQLLEASAERSQ